MQTLRRAPRPRLFSTAPPRPSRPGVLRAFFLVGTVSLSAYTAGSLYPHPYFTFVAPRPAPGPPADPDSPDSLAYSANLERILQSLPFLQSLRTAPDADDWYEARPYKDFPEDRRVNNLSAGALRGQGKLALLPLVRVKRDESEAVVIVHVGRGLCGFDGIVHGGLIATVLDECFGRLAVRNLPDKVGVTANISVNYKAPTFADQFLVIKVRVEDKNGRKVKVSGRVEDLKGDLLADAHALFVQPKYSKMLRHPLIDKALGEPEPWKNDPGSLVKDIPPLAAKP